MTTPRPRGFTIFFAVLVGSLALSIGLSIYELLIRELELSQVATQSQFAIYAADAGAECALYWDTLCTNTGIGCICTDKSGGTCVRGTAFATSSQTLARNPTAGVYCTALSTGATSPHDIAGDGIPTTFSTDLTVPPRLTSAGNGVPSVSWNNWSEVGPGSNATTTFVVLLPGPTGAVTTGSPCAKVTVGKNEPSSGVPHKTTIISQGYNTCSDNANLVRVERTFQVSY
jgi:hypothetical protein